MTADSANVTSADDLSVEALRETLSAALLQDDVSDALWQLVDNGLAERIVPELLALRLEQDPIHKHKDVLSHTIAVTSKTPPDLKIRLAALFHDIGKPLTRSFEHGGVTFRHHEAVGAKMTKKRLRAPEYPTDVVKDVTELVRLSGRFKGYADGWGDSAVRRYARDAGYLLGALNTLVRSDCTTRNHRKRLELHHHVDELEDRIAELAEADRRDAERPLLDGQAVMDRLQLEPGPLVGKAMVFLLELRRQEPGLDEVATAERLDRWYAEQRSA
jgi:poly(A) polymerase